jgi:hypothetical protein
LFNGKLIKIKTDELQKKKALDLFKEYIKSLGFNKKDLLVNDMRLHALYNNTKEEHHQHPHTDNMYPAPRNRNVDITLLRLLLFQQTVKGSV